MAVAEKIADRPVNYGGVTAFPSDFVSVEARFGDSDFRHPIVSERSIVSQDNVDAALEWLMSRLDKINRNKDREVERAREQYLVPANEEDTEVDETQYNDIVKQIETNVQSLVDAAYSEYHEKLLVSDAELSSTPEYKKLLVNSEMRLQGVSSAVAQKVIQSDFVRQLKELRSAAVSQIVGQGANLETYLGSQYENALIDDTIEEVHVDTTKIASLEPAVSGAMVVPEVENVELSEPEFEWEVNDLSTLQDATVVLDDLQMAREVEEVELLEPEFKQEIEDPSVHSEITDQDVSQVDEGSKPVVSKNIGRQGETVPQWTVEQSVNQVSSGFSIANHEADKDVGSVYIRTSMYADIHSPSVRDSNSRSEMSHLSNADTGVHESVRGDGSKHEMSHLSNVDTGMHASTRSDSSKHEMSHLSNQDASVHESIRGDGSKHEMSHLSNQDASVHGVDPDLKAKIKTLLTKKDLGSFAKDAALVSKVGTLDRATPSTSGRSEENKGVSR